MENLILLEFMYCLHISIRRLLHSNRSLSCFRDLRDVILITEGKARGDYRCIPKVSKQLRDLLEYNNWPRLWLYLSVSLYDIEIFDEVSIGF